MTNCFQALLSISTFAATTGFWLDAECFQYEDAVIEQTSATHVGRHTGSPTNVGNLVETGSHFHMANSASLPVPIPKRIARSKAFVWASHVRPIPA